MKVFAPARLSARSWAHAVVMACPVRRGAGGRRADGRCSGALRDAGGPERQIPAPAGPARGAPLPGGRSGADRRLPGALHAALEPGEPSRCRGARCFKIRIEELQAIQQLNQTSQTQTFVDGFGRGRRPGPSKRS